MKVVITGGAGFIGSQLGYHYHKLGHDVHLVDDFSYGNRDNLKVGGEKFGTLHELDVRSAEIETVLHDAAIVVHLAGVAPLPDCQVDPQRAYSVNVGGLASVLEACRRKAVPRILFASTSAVYENSSRTQRRGHDIGYEESAKVNPDTTYAMTKYAAEGLCHSYNNNYGDMSVGILRFFNVYGPHQDFLRSHPPFTGYVAKCLANDETPILFNNSLAERDYIFVDDLISLVVKIGCQEDKRGVYNVGSGVGFSVPKLYQIFLEVSGKDIEPEFRSPFSYWDKYTSLHDSVYPFSVSRIQQEVFKHSVANMSKCKQEFDWEPSFGIKEGISRVYNFVLNNK